MRAPSLFVPRDIQWGQYLEGWWTKRQPTVPGLYAVASNEGGAFVGYRTWVLRFGLDGEAICVQAGTGPNEPGWQGWIWSAPVPQPPANVPESELETYATKERAEALLGWITALEDRQKELRAVRKRVLGR